MAYFLRMEATRARGSGMIAGQIWKCAGAEGITNNIIPHQANTSPLHDNFTQQNLISLPQRYQELPSVWPFRPSRLLVVQIDPCFNLCGIDTQKSGVSTIFWLFNTNLSMNQLDLVTSDFGHQSPHG